MANAYSAFSPFAQQLLQSQSGQNYLNQGGQVYWQQQPNGSTAYQGTQPGNISVLSPTPTTTPTPTQTNNQPGGVTPDGSYSVGYNGPSQADPYAGVRSEISSGYDNYFRQLDDMMGSGLTQQKTAQENIVANQYQSGLTDLTGQKTQGLADLTTEKRKTGEQTSKTLKTLAEDLRNSMFAGSVKLGAMGAGDSSAANQMSYAYTKLGNKARGDVLGQQSSILNDIGDREFKLNNIFNTESNKLKYDTDSKIQSIASWYADAQNQIRQMRANGELSKSKDLASISQNALQYAMNQMMTVQQNATNQQNALMSWAMSKSQDISSLKKNMAGISTMTNPGIQYNGATQLAQAPASSNWGYFPGSTQDKEKGIFS